MELVKDKVPQKGNQLALNGKMLKKGGRKKRIVLVFFC